MALCEASPESLHTFCQMATESWRTWREQYIATHHRIWLNFSYSERKNGQIFPNHCSLSWCGVRSVLYHNQGCLVLSDIMSKLKHQRLSTLHNLWPGLYGSSGSPGFALLANLTLNWPLWIGWILRVQCEERGTNTGQSHHRDCIVTFPKCYKQNLN